MSEQPKPLEGPERLIGSRVLDFDLKEVVGSGGMSVVYRAQHHLTHQEVAVKILPPELAVHEDLKARFVAEARVLARLEHPNIVSLNNLTEAGGRLCLVMQFVDGATLEQRIVAAGRMAPMETMRVGIEVLKALDYAHHHQVIHRDIKPSNILVRADGSVKVTDFGIAKILGQSRLTTTGQTMGTVRYMSPEQVRGREIDARSDLYSLGVTLYEALAGQTPFEGGTSFAIMQQHLDEPPPPLRPYGVSVALEAIIFKAMAKKATQRFADANAFRQALEAELTDHSARPKSASSRPNPKGGIWLAAIGAACALGAASWIYIGRASRAKPPLSVAAAPPAPVSPKSSWIAPYALPGFKPLVDQTFDADGLRLLSGVPLDSEKFRNRYIKTRAELRQFLATREPPVVRAVAHSWRPLPLSVVVIAPELLNRPELWRGYPVEAGRSYSSRYIEPSRTLFLGYVPGFDGKELAYGIAQHVLAPERQLTDEQLANLAEGFESYSSSSSERTR